LDDQLNQTSLKVIQRIKELEVHEGWKPNGNKPCDMFKMEIENRIASKGTAIVPYNIEKIYEFLGKEETLLKLNPMLSEMKILHNVEGEYRVNYMRYKGVWPVADRDFVNVARKLREDEGKAYIGTTSCNYPFPAVDKVVRGEVYIGGYIIEKIDESNTRVTYISDADMKGSIPGMVKNTLSSKQG